MRVKELAARLKSEKPDDSDTDDLLFAATRFWAPLIRWAHDQPATGKIGVPSQAYLQVWIDRAERVLDVPSGEDEEDVVAAPDDPTRPKRFPFKKVAGGAAALLIAVALVGALTGNDTPEAASRAGAATDPIVAPVGQPGSGDAGSGSQEAQSESPERDALSTRELVETAIDGFVNSDATDLRTLTGEGDGCEIALACTSAALTDVLTILGSSDPPAGRVGVFAYDETTAAAVAGDDTGQFWCASLDNTNGTVTYGSGPSSEEALLDCNNEAWT